MNIRLDTSVATLLIFQFTATATAASPACDEAAAALARAVAFYRNHVSAEGGYLWRYSADLAHREGEGRAGRLTAWVQSPGTPRVGQAYLTAYRLTGEKDYLQAAHDTALALVRGQLRSGGWDYRIEFDPDQRRRYAYRVEEPNPEGRNVTTLDDNNTQSALRFLIAVDQVLDPPDVRIREAAEYALTALLQAQYPNGAWPQRYSRFPDADAHPAKAADYPANWPRQWPDADYRGYYTFNDNTLADMIETMLAAADAYDEPKYRAAAERAGGFILMAQMPEPQPAWAQQYDADMHPAWARKFEPPAITGGESQRVLRTLLLLYRQTGDRAYLAPVPRAIEYLRRSQLPDGRLARFYELRTNRPLYFTKQYELTYHSDDLPTHYGFIMRNRLDQIAEEYAELAERGSQPPASAERPPASGARITAELAQSARSIIDAQDERGAWVEPGRLRTIPGDNPQPILSSRTFCSHVETLARYVAACRAAQRP